MSTKRKPAATVNEDQRWPHRTRCTATIEHLGRVYGCVYGKGHDEGQGREHGAEVRDEYGHTTHDLVWTTGESRPRVHPGEWWSTEVEDQVRKEGCRVAVTRYE